MFARAQFGDMGRKVWWDLELQRDGGYRPTEKPANRRGLQQDLRLRSGQSREQQKRLKTVVGARRRTPPPGLPPGHERRRPRGPRAG